MESPLTENSSADLNRAIEGLIRGREFTRRLKEIIKKPLVLDGEVATIMAEDLVGKIMDSFSETLSVINNSDDVRVVGTPVEVKSPEDYSSASCKSSDRRGCYKRRKTSQSKIKESSGLVDDGHAWRKYGQKQILHSTYPRHYFRCTHKYDQKCQASKQVQKIQDNPPLYRTTYYGHHTCKAFRRASPIILDSTMDGDSNSVLLSFDQNNYHPNSSSNNNNNVTTFRSIKQEAKEEIFSFYPKIEDQIQSSISNYFLPAAANDIHLTPAIFETSGGQVAAAALSPDVISSGVYSSCTTTTSSNDNLEIGIDFEECLWNFEGYS